MEQSGGTLPAGDRKTIQGIDTSLNLLQSLSSAYNRAGGGQGFGGGTLTDLFGKFGLNRNASDYNNQRKSLGTAIVKNFVNLGMTETDAKRYEAMLPNFSDSKEQAAYKFQILADLLNSAKQGVFDSQEY